MATYIIETAQEFQVTYRVEADSPEEAWEALMDGEGICEDQMPGDIIDTFDGSSVEEDVDA